MGATTLLFERIAVVGIWAYPIVRTRLGQTYLFPGVLLIEALALGRNPVGDDLVVVDVYVLTMI